jgi:hypothetical protein
LGGTEALAHILRGPAGPSHEQASQLEREPTRFPPSRACYMSYKRITLQLCHLLKY